MVTIQDAGLKEGIQEAIRRAKAISKPVLVSEVQKINKHIDVLSFFASGKEKFLGERFFWKDPSNEIILIGIGICKQIQSDQATDRFFHVETDWKRFIEDAFIYNPYNENGVGPIIFGGFSFDPLKEKTELWSKYANSLFYIPKYLISIINGQTFLTTNIMCTQHDDIYLYDQLLKERERLLKYYQSADYGENATLFKMSETNPEEWKETVTKLVERLHNGPLKKAVLARELRLFFNREVPIENILDRLIMEQKDSFIFAFEANGDCFIGASPERLVKKTGLTLLSTCLAGSIARGKDIEEDEKLGNELLSDQKNLIEHQYVVDMIKEAMQEVCDRVELPNKPELYKVRDIQHLYTPVIGETDRNTSLFQLVDLLHPTPALGGLPKKEAVEVIREIEELDRGLYAAPIGWMDYRDNGEFAVAIRSALIQGKEASLFAGCGIVKDSNVESEYLETNIKFRPMLSALGGMK